MSDNRSETLNFNKDIENRFTYHNPNKEQADTFPIIREKAKELAYIFELHCPTCREYSLALTKLEEAVMWANAGISRYGIKKN